MPIIAIALAAAPVCTVASHDRLIVQVGRDVCASARNDRGEPVAAGFLPTACADPRATYQVDARGKVDLCIRNGDHA